MFRKVFLPSLLIAAFAPVGGAAQTSSSMPDSVSALGGDLAHRFVVRPQWLVLDYANLDGSVDLPSSEDCAAGRPNALSWWTPLENGPFLTGLYLDAVLRRHAAFATSADAALARQFVAGLLRCADPDGSVPGFIARGVYGPDLSKPSFYGVGSDDQTAPWFFGLWRYLNSGIPTKDEKNGIVAAMAATAEALRQHRWNMPCVPIGDLAAGQYRGGWSGADFRGATRLLFVAKIMHELTGDPAWLKTYDDKLAETFHSGDATGLSRLELVASGMTLEWRSHPELRNHLWIYVVSQAMLDELARLEKRDEIRNAYLQSLQENARACADTVIAAAPAETWNTPFRTDWKTLSASWRPQRSPDEAVAVALAQIRAWNNRGRELEMKWIREPACAAWIAFYAPSFTPEIEAAAARFQHFIRTTEWTRLRASHGLFAESAWHLLNVSHPDIAPNANAAGPVVAVSSPAPQISQSTAPALTAKVVTSVLDANATRCFQQFPFLKIPPELQGQTLHVVPRGTGSRPGASFTVKARAGSTAWLLVMDKGNPDIPAEWQRTSLAVEWDSGPGPYRDRVYRRNITADTELVIPESNGNEAGGTYAIPHALVIGPAK